jgi:hypothetical protein
MYMMKIITTALLIFLLGNMPVISSENITENSSILPEYFNYRDIDGIDYTTPIKDQAPAPTCEAYALCAALETLIQFQTGELFEPDLSDCHLYFYAGGTYEAGYVNLIDAANYLVDHGVPDEGCYPDPHRAFDYPFQSVEGWENRTVKIQDWGWVDHDIESIKRALIDYGPLVICAWIWKDFNYYKQGVYKHRWGQLTGGHVMTIVGYDDSQQCWIVRNSWGTKWGDNGWFKLAYDAEMITDKWYGEGSGIMYVDGVYGNFHPDVPKVYIETPKIYKTYIFGMEIKTIIRKLPIQKGAARFFGNLQVKTITENSDKVEFYIDNELINVDYSPPFSCNMRPSRGLHTLEVRAYKNNNYSIDIRDIYMFF